MAKRNGSKPRGKKDGDRTLIPFSSSELAHYQGMSRQIADLEDQKSRLEERISDLSGIRDAFITMLIDNAGIDPFPGSSWETFQNGSEAGIAVVKPPKKADAKR